MRYKNRQRRLRDTDGIRLGPGKLNHFIPMDKEKLPSIFIEVHPHRSNSLRSQRIEASEGEYSKAYRSGVKKERYCIEIEFCFEEIELQLVVIFRNYDCNSFLKMSYFSRITPDIPLNRPLSSYSPLFLEFSETLLVLLLLLHYSHPSHEEALLMATVVESVFCNDRSSSSAAPSRTSLIKA